MDRDQNNRLQNFTLLACAATIGIFLRNKTLPRVSNVFNSVGELKFPSIKDSFLSDLPNINLMVGRDPFVSASPSSKVYELEYEKKSFRTIEIANRLFSLDSFSKDEKRFINYIIDRIPDIDPNNAITKLSPLMRTLSIVLSALSQDTLPIKSFPIISENKKLIKVLDLEALNEEFKIYDSSFFLSIMEKINAIHDKIVLSSPFPSEEIVLTPVQRNSLVYRCEKLKSKLIIFSPQDLEVGKETIANREHFFQAVNSENVNVSVLPSQFSEQFDKFVLSDQVYVMFYQYQDETPVAITKENYKEIFDKTKFSILDPLPFFEFLSHWNPDKFEHIAIRNFNLFQVEMPKEFFFQSGNFGEYLIESINLMRSRLHEIDPQSPNPKLTKEALNQMLSYCKYMYETCIDTISSGIPGLKKTERKQAAEFLFEFGLITEEIEQKLIEKFFGDLGYRVMKIPADSRIPTFTSPLYHIFKLPEDFSFVS